MNSRAYVSECRHRLYMPLSRIPTLKMNSTNFFFCIFNFRGSGIPSSYLNSTIRYSLVNGSIETMIKQWKERKKIITSNRTWLTFFFTSDKALYLIDDATKRQRDNHELPKKKKWRREEEEEKNLTKIPQNITRLR